jgi:hemolysin III
MSLLLLLFVSSGVGAAKRNDSAHIWLERMRAALAPSSSTQARATLETWDGFEVGTVIEMKVSRHTSPAEKRTLMELTQPDAAKGTVYEVVAGSEGSLEGWEYLPSVRRLRRMSGIHRTDLFMGTEFSYEALDFVGSMERVPGRVEWVREEGRSLVRVTSPPGLSSGKVVTLIEPMTALPVRIAFFEESGELIRVQEFGSGSEPDLAEGRGPTLPGAQSLVSTKEQAWSRMQNPVRGLLNGTAALLSAVGAGLLWVRCSGDASDRAVLLVFALSLVALYTASCLYHCVPWQRLWKQRMQRIDHSMIYVLIAGSITPIAWLAVDGWPRWVWLGLAWGVALIGIAQKAFGPKLGDGFSITLQTLQGWLALPLFVPLVARLPWLALALALGGGALYMIGMVLFVTRQPRLWPGVFSYHEVFHVFVVGGSSAHFLLALWYIAPSAAS